MAENDGQAFINYQSGNFNSTSKEWVLSADQWIQTYYQFRDGKLYFVENDNKEQTYNEREVEIAAFVSQNATRTEAPYPDMLAFLKGVLAG